VTERRSRGEGETKRRRLLPAALLVVPVCAVALVVVAVATSHDSRPADPPVGRTLPPDALAAEQPPSAQPHRRHRRRIRRVNVIDRVAPAPRRISIPAIGVSARIIPLRLGADGTMQTPTRWEDTGWFEPGPEPGERGPAVITGHVDSTSGPAVFYRLRELRRGDRIGVRRSDGSVVRFRVEGLERWPKAEFPTRRVFGKTHIAALRLVTCSGNFDASSGHYVDNTIVYAARVRVRRRVD
jgi:sortase (surface protein transpeptidase)